MLKVLIIAYDFPPYVSVGGLRPYGWFQDLSKFGIYPIVVTRQWDHCQGKQTDYISPGISDKIIFDCSEHGIIVKSPFKPHIGNKLLLKYGDTRFKALRKIFSAFFEIGQFLLPVGNKYVLYRTAKQFLENESVDAIIATGDPFILFRYASKLSSQFKIPWIADFRDPWSKTDLHRKGFVQKKFEYYFEKKLTSDAHRIITVSEIMFRQIATNQPEKLNVIENGFNENLIVQTKEVKQTSECMTISLVGSVYKHHPIEHFLNNLHQFLIDNHHIQLQLRFYGLNIQKELQSYISKKCPSLIHRTVFIQKLPNAELLIELAKTNILLLFNAYATSGTKIYEYIALKRRILFCFSNDAYAKQLYDQHYRLKVGAEDNLNVQAEMITATNSGIVVRDAQHLLVVLKELWDEFQAKGYIECNSHGIEYYSRRHQTEKLATLIKKVVEEYRQKKG